MQKATCPHKALRSRSRPRRRPRPRIRPRGVMECWSNGVLRHVRIAPRVRGVGDAEGAEDRAAELSLKSEFRGAN